MCVMTDDTAVDQCLTSMRMRQIPEPVLFVGISAGESVAQFTCFRSVFLEFRVEVYVT